MKFAQEVSDGLHHKSQFIQLTGSLPQRGWSVSPTQQLITFPQSSKADIQIAATQLGDTPVTVSLDVLQGKGVSKGASLSSMVGPSLKLAQQLEAIV